MATRAKTVCTSEGITLQESLFADHYVLDWNGKHAATRVGVPARSAAQWASERLRNPAVCAAIERRVAALRHSVQEAHQKVIEELVALATSRIDKYSVDAAGYLTYDGERLQPGDVALAPIRRIEREEFRERDPAHSGEYRTGYRIRIELWDKNTALRMLGTHLGMFVTRAEIATGASHIAAGAAWQIGNKRVRL